jgi:hypothetical protein
VQEFVTTMHGYRLATSVGGVLPGRGADLIILDDPLKPDQALSEAQRERVNEWYDNTLYTLCLPKTSYESEFDQLQNCFRIDTLK